MADYGIKVSEPGKDVTTAEDKELIYTSSAEAHKISTSGTVTESTNIEHGLGYEPHADIYFYDGSSVWKGGKTYGTGLGGTLPEVYTTNDSTYVRITFNGAGATKAFYVIFYEGDN